MKNLIYLCLFAFYFSTCTSGTQSDTVIEKDVGNTTPEVELTNPNNESELSSESSIYYEYEGELEGGIPLELKFHELNGLIKGELVYKKVGKPITILGIVDENALYDIAEFGKNGMITGLLRGKFGTEGENLSWFSPESRKNLKMVLKLKTEKESDVDFNHGNIVGKYRYEYGQEGAVGNLIVHKLTKDSIHFDLFCLTHAPARNMATLEEAIMVIDDNKVSIDFKEDKFYDCAYDILFYNDFVRIKYIDDRMKCGFGHNAYVEGVFVKIEE